MPPKQLKIDSLELDLENPRITLATDQRDAMQKILNEQKVRLINLAESIALKGLSPMDRFLVLRSSKQGRFIVLEGNRRVLALKLLKNRALVADLQISDAFRKRLQKASLTFDARKVEPLDCFEVEDRALGNDWIRQRHNGEDSGRGIVDWSGVAGARFRGRSPALQALDFVIEHAELTEDQGEAIANRFPLTTLERLLSTPDVRAALGFYVDGGKLLTDLPASEALKPLRRLVLDLAEKEITVTEVKSKVQQLNYINRLKPTDRADHSLKTGVQRPVETIQEKDFAVKSTAAPKAPRAPRPAVRTAIVPKGCKLNVTNPKISGIYEELRVLQLAKHVHAIGVLLRVFLEMSVDDYLVVKAKSSLKFAMPKGGGMQDKKLRDKVQECIAHMVSAGADKKDFLGVSKGFTDPSHPFSIDTLHAYIHNRFFTPVDSHLTAAWDNAQPFFEKIWP